MENGELDIKTIIRHVKRELRKDGLFRRASDRIKKERIVADPFEIFVQYRNHFFSIDLMRDENEELCWRVVSFGKDVYRIKIRDRNTIRLCFQAIRSHQRQA